MRVKRVIIFFIIIFILSPGIKAPELYAVPDKYENNYLHLKGIGKYREALDVLNDWTLSLNDSMLIEVNVFRIGELMVYPELYSMGIDILENIREKNKKAVNGFVISRIDNYLNILYLKQGVIEKSKSVMKKMGFINFDIIGPFKNNSVDDFETRHLEEQVKGKRYNGKHYDVEWFSAVSERTGSVNPGSLFFGTEDTLFYLHSLITVSRDDTYNIMIGKTGYTDIWLNGKKIFSNREKHGYNFDQYNIRLFLNRGKHRLLIKTGDLSGAVKISARLTDKKGNIVIQQDAPDIKTGPGFKIEKSSYFGSLSSLLSKKEKDENSSFLAGYLMYMSGLGDYDNREITVLLTRTGMKSRLYSAAAYYMGISEQDNENREEYLKKSIDADNGNLEALREIIRIKLKNSFFHEAYPLIEKIKTSGKNHHLYNQLLSEFFYTRGWDYEVLKHAEILKTSGYPSTGYSILSKIYKKQKYYSKSADNLENIYNMDRYDKKVIMQLMDLYRKSGKSEKELSLLHQGIIIFPDSVDFRLRIADFPASGNGGLSPLVYLSSAQRISPYNKKTLHRLGLFYHMMGKTRTAVYYLNMALNYDPDNYSLKRYLNIITGRENEIHKYMFNGSIEELYKKADKYRDEAAVRLLDETGYRVFSNGSHEKYIHRIIKINNSSAVNNFENQYIVFDPTTDKIENLKCYVINNGNRVEITNSYTKSLSDPESRLYYNLEAVIIPLSSLRKGSIIDISYIVSNSGGGIYKNYFGDRIIAGSEFRTTVSNTILSYPDNKKIFAHLKNMDSVKKRVYRHQQRNIYHIKKENILPFKKETAMPPLSDILPSIYFTSHRNWGEMHTWYISLLRKKIRLSPEMKKQLKLLVKPGMNQEEIVSRIYDHVTGAIRYVGFEFGIGGIQPRSCDLTYSSKMGDCKDISLVLIAMLREAGIDTRLALIRTREKGKANTDIPYIGEFNHAICYVKIKNKKNGYIEFFIDGTADYTGFREINDEIRGIDALVIDKDGYRFINTESSFYKPNIQKVSTTIQLSPDGDARLSRTILKSGSWAPGARREATNLRKKETSLNNYWNSTFPGSSISDIILLSSEIDKPVSFSYNVDIKSFAQSGENEIIFKSFLIPSNYYKNYAVTGKRIFPVIMSGSGKTEVKIEYIFPEGYRIHRIPGNSTFNHNKFSASFKYTATENGLTVSSTIILKDYNIEVQEYPDFRKFSQLIQRKELEPVVLVKIK